ncbi:hypothetical protein ApAK_01380 [Thermoplasmatales archaeon AK]|nr:hypothetical protein [Thermoplasmatales archaeon AK]
MNSLMKSVIAILLVVSVGAPVGYMAYQLSASPNMSVQDYIPANSTVVAEFNLNHTQGYFFISNANPALIVPVSLTNLSNALTNSSSSGLSINGSTGIDVSQYGTYKGYDIYNITFSNLSVLSLYGLANLSIPINITKLSTVNGRIFVVPVVSNDMIIGSLNGVRYAIDAGTGNAKDQFQVTGYFETGANLSLFVRAENYSISHFTLNLFQNRTDANITFTNSSAGQKMLFYASALAGALNVSIISEKLGTDYLEFTLGIGVDNLPALFKFPGYISLTRYL